MTPLKQRRLGGPALAGSCLFLCLVGGAEAASSKSKPLFTLCDPGQEKNVDYEKYGQFTGVGSPKYRYLIRDREGLLRAVGEGIYPTVTGLLKDPQYQRYQFDGKLEASLWDFVTTDDIQANFYKWASSTEQPGVKQFYAADMLERAGLLTQAIKGYYTSVVHFPKTAGSTFWTTPWYIGPTALDPAPFLTRQHPKPHLHPDAGLIRVRNGFDDDIHNDIYEIDPGKIVTVSEQDAAHRATRVDLSKEAVKQQR